MADVLSSIASVPLQPLNYIADVLSYIVLISYSRFITLLLCMQGIWAVT
jgi:hypothetical protein